MALEDFLPALTNVLHQSVEGIQAAYTFDNLPAQLGAFPCFVVMPLRGSQDIGGANIALYDIQAVLYCSPANLPEAYLYCVRSIDKVRRAIFSNIKLGGLVDRCVPAEGNWFEMGNVTSVYSDKVYIGVIYHLLIKETADINAEA